MIKLKTIFSCTVTLMLAVAAFSTTAFGTCTLTEQTVEELRLARLGTARYHNILTAEADGFSDAHIFIEQMGHHWLNETLLNDGVFDPGSPELMVYADLGGGQKRLVAVEYAIPITDPNTPPSGFDGDCDHWDVYGGVLWTLHAWIWYPNPDGIFAHLNTRIPVTDGGTQTPH